LRTRRIWPGVVFLACVGSFTWAAQDEPPACARALVLGTRALDPEGIYARNMTDWLGRFVTVLEKQGHVPLENIRVLADHEAPEAKPPVLRSTLVNVRAAFEKLKRELRPVDQFILFIVGHGTVTDPVGKLCLPGADLKATELADLIDELPTRRIVIVNCASGGAAFLEKYSRPVRVVVSACGITGQGNQTYFAEFFLMAYEQGKADTDGDGVVTVLEAFNRAAHQCINWYHRQYKVRKEKGEPQLPREVVVHTAEARRLFTKFYDGVKDLRLIAPPAGTDEDENTEPNFEGAASLPLRRESGEHASLEDRGENTGALHWYENKHHVLTGEPGTQGEVAARTVLGTPVLLPPRR